MLAACIVAITDAFHALPQDLKVGTTIGGYAFDQSIDDLVWSGRRESNPRMQLGKLPFYH